MNKTIKIFLHFIGLCLWAFGEDILIKLEIVHNTYIIGWILAMVGVLLICANEIYTFVMKKDFNLMIHTSIVAIGFLLTKHFGLDNRDYLSLIIGMIILLVIDVICLKKLKQ